MERASALRHLAQWWPDEPAPLVPPAMVELGHPEWLPAGRFPDLVNGVLARRPPEVLILSDGCTLVPTPAILALEALASAEGLVVAAGPDEARDARVLACPSDLLLEHGGLNPSLRAFYWAEDLAARIGACTVVSLALTDLFVERSTVMGLGYYDMIHDHAVVKAGLPGTPVPDERT